MDHLPETILEWPETRKGEGRSVPKWKIKTDDEEYLERLEGKLARLQRDGPKPKPERRHTSSDISSLSDGDSEDGDDQTEENADEDGETQMKDDDAGVHLLHSVDAQPPRVLPSDNREPFSAENALHLRLGDQTSSFNISPKPSGTAECSPLATYAQSVAPPLETTNKTRPSFPFRVRFRSRVRIGSGIRHNKSRTSLDSSPSSSISAPLRYSSYESEQGSSYAQMISDVASVIGGREPSLSQSDATYNPHTSGKKFRRYGSVPAAAAAVGERTPLFTTANETHSTRSYGHHVRRPSLSQIPDSDAEGDDLAQRDARLRRSLQQAPRKSEEEVMFGKWPWRISNGNWWLWKLEPICGCCYTDDETDSDLD